MKQRIEFGKIAIQSGLKYSLLHFEPNEISANYQTAEYIGQDGADVLEATYEPRYIILQGHIMAHSEREFFALRQKLIAECDGKTERDLVYFEGLNHYKAKAIAAVPIFSGRQGYCLPFSIKFTVPSFYWMSKDDIKRDVITHVPLIGTINFSPTYMFSQTSTQATIINESIPTPLIVEITCKSGTSSPTYGLVISNITTGESITIQRDLDVGETITINTENATVTSSKDGDVITSVSDDSILDMMLQSGINTIKAENLNVNKTVSALLKYQNRYVGV